MGAPCVDYAVRCVCVVCLVRLADHVGCAPGSPAAPGAGPSCQSHIRISPHAVLAALVQKGARGGGEDTGGVARLPVQDGVLAEVVGSSDHTDGAAQAPGARHSQLPALRHPHLAGTLPSRRHRKSGVSSAARITSGEFMYTYRDMSFYMYIYIYI